VLEVGSLYSGLRSWTIANLRFELLDVLGDSSHAFGQFDFVCGNGILHHLVRRLPEVLRALQGLVKPGGDLAFIEPNLLNPYCAAICGTAIGRRLARLEPDEMAFTPGQLRRVLAGAGWRRGEDPRLPATGPAGALGTTDRGCGTGA
jgi:2-polyprenyl-3-methyl-5-hydroxy-6-metoxy-1,4-benzoquinol methylase